MAAKPNNFATNLRHAHKAKILKLSVVGLPETPQEEQSLRFKRGQQLSFQSELMRELYELAQTYARSSAAVIVSGESGSGKELFSRLIHEHSCRDQFPFVAVNCAAISEALAESEFFGHEKGAYTGADRYHIGHFERANGGTLLLDEISEIPLTMQAKMLRVIEEQEVLPVGGNSPRPIDVRIVATTNRELVTEVQQGKFREDLYHRLSVLELRLPPLRKRKSDIPLLANNFVQKFQCESIAGELKVSPEAMEKLCELDWPGNVRQLRNVIHRACIVCKDSQIGVNCIQAPMLDTSENEFPNSLFGMKLADAERHLILAALSKYDGSKRLAANELGVTSRTLANKLRAYNGTNGTV
jgi:DNA-binding NtrC family response regulator